MDDDHLQTFYHVFGCPSYHPKMLLSELLVAYSQGIFSGRKIEKMMIEKLAMQYLIRLLVVSYRTINRFRVAAGMEALICDLFIDLNLRLKMADLTQDMEEKPIKGKGERKTKRRKLKKLLRKVKADFSVLAEKYETYHSTFNGRNSFSQTDTDATRKPHE